MPRKYLTSDADNNNAVANTLEDVGNLSFPVANGRYTYFRFYVTYSAAATTTGSRWTINCTSTPTFLSYHSQYALTSTSWTFNVGLDTKQLPAACNATSATTSSSNLAIVEGVLLASADDVVQLQHASEVTSSLISAKADVSWIDWREFA